MRRPLHIGAPCLQHHSPRVLFSVRAVTTTAARPYFVGPPAGHPNRVPLQDITPTHISYYWDTQAPTRAQLNYADKFFSVTRHSPIMKWAASQFRTTPNSFEPEVAFVGRSNVGKSSLLNRVMGKEMCWTSSKPGRTREMNAYGVGGTKGGESKVVVLDMPGYGRGSRPEWGWEILKYLCGRKQLRRVFVLVDSTHGLKNTDIALLRLFREHAIPHQVVLSKVDRLLSRKPSHLRDGLPTAGLSLVQEMLQYLRTIVQPTGQGEGPGALGELLTCCADTHPILGISELRWAILAATGYGGSIEVTNAKPGLNPTLEPAAKPAAILTAKPAANPAAKSGTKSGAKPAAKSATKRGTRRATRRGAKPAAKSGTKPGAKTAMKSAATATKRGMRRGTKRGAKPGAKPVKKPVKKSAASAPGPPPSV